MRSYRRERPTRRSMGVPACVPMRARFVDCGGYLVCVHLCRFYGDYVEFAGRCGWMFVAGGMPLSSWLADVATGRAQGLMPPMAGV